jgi:MFS family permease
LRLWNRGVSSLAAEAVGTTSKAPSMGLVVPVLGVTQILAWGSSYYLLAVLAEPIPGSTDWPLAWVVSGLSLGLLTAGLVSPRVGDSIERHGGRPVLATSAALLAFGLVGLALAPSLLIYLAAWLVLGIGMGAGLYDAAFATLGRLYGLRAPTAIGTLTLFGGLASTVCWPLSAFLVSEYGWRGACLIYAGIHLAVVLPLYMFALPREPRRHVTTSAPRDGQIHKGRTKGPVPAGSMLVFMLLAATITVSSMISTVVSVHLLSILRAQDIALAAAVALGALVGPAQVGARALEMLIGRYHHPIWTMVASTLFVAIGVGALWGGLPIISAALVFYGAGIGLESIARGTLPLALFGVDRYAAIMGRIAMPSLVAQAVSPSLSVSLMERSGASGTLAALFAFAILDVVLVFALFALLPRRKVLIATR